MEHVGDNTDQWPIAFVESHRDRHLRDVVQEVHGPVERIDQPPAPVRDIPAGFLGQDSVLGR